MISGKQIRKSFRRLKGALGIKNPDPQQNENKENVEPEKEPKRNSIDSVSDSDESSIDLEDFNKSDQPFDKINFKRHFKYNNKNEKDFWTETKQEEVHEDDKSKQILSSYKNSWFKFLTEPMREEVENKLIESGLWGKVNPLYFLTKSNRIEIYDHSAIDSICKMVNMVKEGNYIFFSNELEVTNERFIYDEKNKRIKIKTSSDPEINPEKQSCIWWYVDENESWYLINKDNKKYFKNLKNFSNSKTSYLNLLSKPTDNKKEILKEFLAQISLARFLPNYDLEPKASFNIYDSLFWFEMTYINYFTRQKIKLNRFLEDANIVEFDGQDSETEYSDEDFLELDHMIEIDGINPDLSRPSIKEKLEGFTESEKIILFSSEMNSIFIDYFRKYKK